MLWLGKNSMAANPILRVGDRKPEVTRLQQLLNAKLRPGPNLKADGTFGPITKVAVERFQVLNWLSTDGIVGPCVWGALEGRDEYVILHRVTLVPQWTPATCWSAALSMLLGGGPACVSPGNATASPTKGLFNDSELSEPGNTKKFADSYHLTLLHAMNWGADSLGVCCGGHMARS